MAVLLPSSSVSTRAAGRFRRNCAFRSPSPLDSSRHKRRVVQNAAHTTVSSDSEPIGLAQTAPRAGSQRQPRPAARKKEAPKFASLDLAYKYYSTKADWTPDDLTDDCLTMAAWDDVASRLRVDPGVSYWYTQGCFLASLGLTQAQVIKALLSATLRTSCTPLTVAVQRQKVAFLMSELSLSRADIAYIMRLHARTLDYSVDGMFRPRIKFFMKYFQLDAPALGRVVKRHPRLLWSHTDDDVQAKINLLCGVVKEPRAVATILARQPAVMALSELTIQDKVRQLVRKLNLDKDQLSKVLARAPSLLLRDLQCVSVTSDILRQYGVPDADLAEVCVRFPNVFGLAPDTVRRKLDFCINTIGFDVGTVVRNPVLLALSLEGRLAPRYKALKELGRQMGHPLWTSPALYLQPDDVFEQSVQLQVQKHHLGFSREQRMSKAQRMRLLSPKLSASPSLAVSMDAATVGGAKR